MISYAVYLLAGAKQDILQLHRYVGVNTSWERAHVFMGALQGVCNRLKVLPFRGKVPPELERIGIHELREVALKPYRIIYHVIGSDVFIDAVMDGRRDIQELLEERVLRQGMSISLPSPSAILPNDGDFERNTWGT
jgi:toxin ParE1/3/4